MITNQQQEIEIKTHSLRFETLIFFTGFLFLILLFRLSYLQIHEGKQLRSFSNSNRFKKKLLIAPRGFILDRKKEILVANIKSTQLIFHHKESSSLNDEILKEIEKIIQIPVENLKKTIHREKKRNGPFHPSTLKENLSLFEIHKLKQLNWIYPEVQIREYNKRVYPLNENGSQFLGFIGSISKKDIQFFKKQKKAFHLADVVGKGGLEKIYNEQLQGQNGFFMLEVDAKNRISRTPSSPFDLLKIQPKKGKNLILTIDKELQKFVLKSMEREDSIGPRTGAVVVMKTNGEILALFSSPGFDPNILSSNIDAHRWKQWSQNKSKLFINKGFQEHYSPGSVFKPFVAIAALNEGLIEKKHFNPLPRGKF